MQRCATARAGGRGVLRAARLSPRVVKRSGEGAGRVGVGASDGLTATGLHHVGVLCKDVKASLDFYEGVLGLARNDDRPDDRLPYDGAWLWVGSGMIHLMQLPNPDPTEGRPDHGGRDRHAAFGVQSVDPLAERLKANGVPYTMSKSGRAAVFFRDPDGNAYEFMQV